MAFKSKFSALKSAMRAIFAELHSVDTTIGVVYYEADELAIGVEVYDEDGPIADGSFVYDGKEYVVVDGKVSDIKGIESVDESNNEAEQVVPETSEMGKVQCESEAEQVVSEGDVNESSESSESGESELVGKVDSLESMIMGLRDDLEKMNAYIITLESRLKDIEKLPEGGVPSEEFHKIDSIDKFSKGIEAIKKMRNESRIK